MQTIQYMGSKARLMTEGVRYTGSKREIIPKIVSTIEKHCPTVNSVLDACAGTTRVSQALRLNGYSVTANDVAAYSKTFANCYLLNTKPKEYYLEWLEELNSIAKVNGWFTKHYGGILTNNEKGNAIQADGKKKPWQVHNTQKLDAVLNHIPKLTQNEVEQSVLLTSTILAMDKVDNTMGHQVAYLKDWSKRSYDNMRLVMPELIPFGKQCYSTQKSIFDIEEYYDLVYLDPPYGTNNQKHKTTRVRYNSYYHIWTTLVLNDRPTLHGAANRRYDASSDLIPGSISIFEHIDHKKVYEATKQLIQKLNCKYLLFSYSNKAKLSENDLESIFGDYKIRLFDKFNHKENAMKHSTINRQWLGDQKQNKEFLILIEK